jgi:hypothetical protein
MIIMTVRVVLALGIGLARSAAAQGGDVPRDTMPTFGNIGSAGMFNMVNRGLRAHDRPKFSR